MEKWMIVYVLPLEVWVDIFRFPWTSRRAFGQLVERIGTFKFAEHAQFYLHEWGRRTLGSLYFDERGLFKCVSNKPYELASLVIPQTELPENIKRFDSIKIRHFDARILAFLAQIGPLLTNLELDLIGIFNCLPNLPTILTGILPLLNSIHTLHCCEGTLPTVRQQLGEKFAGIKQLRYHHYDDGEAKALVEENVQIIMDWLTRPADNSNEWGPKLCEVSLLNGQALVEQITLAVRQQFLAAHTPSTFALNFSFAVGRKLEVAEFHLTNDIGEQLRGQLTEDGDFQITRHPASCNTREVREWIETMMGNHGGRIKIYNPTVGLLDNIAQMDGAQDDQQQQPSTSEGSS